jgi:hypothetical protein
MASSQHRRLGPDVWSHRHRSVIVRATAIDIVCREELEAPPLDGRPDGLPC